MAERYKITKQDIEAILFHVDPANLNFAPEDEYAPEAELIIKELDTCQGFDDINALLVRVFIEMFDEKIVGPGGLKKLGLAAKIISDEDLFDYVTAEIKREQENRWYIERLRKQAEANGYKVEFPGPDNYNQGIEASALLVEHNPALFEGPDARERIVAKIRSLKVD